MFLRANKRFKDGKEHRYWSVVENRRVAGGRSVQKTLLYLGEINDTDRAAWTRAIEAVDEGAVLDQLAPEIAVAARKTLAARPKLMEVIFGGLRHDLEYQIQETAKCRGRGAEERGVLAARVFGTTTIAFAPKCPVDQSCDTADACIDSDGVHRAIVRARAAFHASVAINNGGSAIVNIEHGMGADLDASAAAYAHRFNQLQGNDILQIAHTRSSVVEILCGSHPPVG